MLLLSKSSHINIICVKNNTQCVANLKQAFLKNPKTRKIYEDLRKEKFGKRTNVLNDDFYENIKPGDIKKLKGVGAISGCMNGFAYGFDKALNK